MISDVDLFLYKLNIGIILLTILLAYISACISILTIDYFKLGDLKNKPRSLFKYTFLLILEFVWIALMFVLNLMVIYIDLNINYVITKPYLKDWLFRFIFIKIVIINFSKISPTKGSHLLFKPCLTILVWYFIFQTLLVMFGIWNIILI